MNEKKKRKTLEEIEKILKENEAVLKARYRELKLTR